MTTRNPDLVVLTSPQITYRGSSRLLRRGRPFVAPDREGLSGGALHSSGVLIVLTGCGESKRDHPNGRVSSSPAS